MDEYNSVTKTKRKEEKSNLMMERKREHFDNEYFEEDIKTENDDEEQYIFISIFLLKFNDVSMLTK